jgi:hypothetical protein
MAHHGQADLAGDLARGADPAIERLTHEGGDQTDEQPGEQAEDGAAGASATLTSCAGVEVAWRNSTRLISSCSVARSPASEEPGPPSWESRWRSTRAAEANCRCATAEVVAAIRRA